MNLRMFRCGTWRTKTRQHQTVFEGLVAAQRELGMDALVPASEAEGGVDGGDAVGAVQAKRRQRRRGLGLATRIRARTTSSSEACSPATAGGGGRRRRRMEAARLVVRAEGHGGARLARRKRWGASEEAGLSEGARWRREGGDRERGGIGSRGDAAAWRETRERAIEEMECSGVLGLDRRWAGIDANGPAWLHVGGLAGRGEGWVG